MKMYTKYLVGMFSLITAMSATASIYCPSLPQWSQPINAMKVNQHHIFCGEINKKGNAVGFHSMPGGDSPSTFIMAEQASAPAASGVYVLKKILLKINGKQVTKSYSSMYPNSCTVAQIEKSIVYAYQHNNGHCTSGVTWAFCGPSAPLGDNSNSYCIGDNGKPLTLATAVDNADKSKINTGFPVDE
ncbi:EndoU domain-containing protein [Celerinatantimonas sp. MCCC 1A17872]|uniref:EndoU domain-containing protein n=1 Tax=Celerinatantimonas sp. MCCC 1A17872 TaxID=3177514 RepID=UPI0038C1FA64